MLVRFVLGILIVRLLMSTLPLPVNLNKWIAENKSQLVPPVNNQCIHKGDDFFVMAVGGPNRRSDYHINPTEEWFYQIRGEMLLKVVDEQQLSTTERFRDIWIREGEMFLLPGRIPHNPIRFENTVGLVIERTRKQHEGHIDCLCWYCQKCHQVVHEARFFLEDVQVQLAQVIDEYAASERLQTCPFCKFVNVPN